MSARDNGPLDCKVYVGNLGSGATEYDLEKVFSYYGPLRSVWVARNPPGFAFVQFEDARDARDACRELDGRLVCGSRVRVEMSTGERRQKRGWNAQPPWSRSEYGWKRSPSPRRSPRRSVSPRRSPRRSPSPRRSLRRSPSPRRKSPSPRRGSKRSSTPRRSPRRSPSPKRSRKPSSSSPKASGRCVSRSRSRSVSPRPRKAAAADAWRSHSPPAKGANSSSGSRRRSRSPS